jgi:hypothetical protein
MITKKSEHFDLVPARPKKDPAGKQVSLNNKQLITYAFDFIYLSYKNKVLKFKKKHSAQH